MKKTKDIRLGQIESEYMSSIRNDMPSEVVNEFHEYMSSIRDNMPSEIRNELHNMYKEKLSLILESALIEFIEDSVKLAKKNPDANIDIRKWCKFFVYMNCSKDTE